MANVVEFWSSVELGPFAPALICALGDAGLRAELRFAVSAEQYRAARGRLTRARLRWQLYGAYPLHLQARLRRPPLPAAIVVCTNTFYAPAAAIRATHAVGVPVVHWVFDLFPDVLAAEGAIAARGLIHDGLARLTRWTFDHAAANVFLGEKLRAHAEQSFGPIPRAHVIPVGADGQMFRAATPQPRPSSQPLRVLYCGNFGRMHDTDAVMGLLAEQVAPPWTIEFRGHGAGLRRVAATAASRPWVRFAESVGTAEWSDVMKDADLALVTLKSGAEGLVMPSKTYSAMVAGQAIVAVCPASSELADTVERHEAGWVVEPGRADQLAAALHEAAGRPDELLRRRRNAFRAGHELYAETALKERWATLLTQVMDAAKQDR